MVWTIDKLIFAFVLIAMNYYYNTCLSLLQLFKDNYAKREVLSLHVHCHAEEHGCVWEGELRNLEVHTVY